MKWISVKDKLPEEGIQVLTIEMPRPNSSFPPEYRLGYIIKFEDKNPTFIWNLQVLDECPNITHWMTLPEPPEELNDC